MGIITYPAAYLAMAWSCCWSSLRVVHTPTASSSSALKGPGWVRAADAMACCPASAFGPTSVAGAVPVGGQSIAQGLAGHAAQSLLAGSENRAVLFSPTFNGASNLPLIITACPLNRSLA